MTQIEPAEQWEVVTIPGLSPDHALAVRAKGVVGYIEVRTRTNFTDLKADADVVVRALNHRDQVVGFTREDVHLLRGNAIELSREFTDADLDGEIAKLRSLADRIEALLPPSEGKS